MDSGLLDSRPPPHRPNPANPVRVWLVLNKYGGDNAQVRGLGDHLERRLGWTCAPRQVRFHPPHVVDREKVPDAIDFAKSDSLSGPFPDVIITCSRFYGMVGAWLKRCADRPMVHVHLGRIAAPMSSFDLLAATAQYGLPRAPNFMPLTLPFVPQDAARGAAAIAAWGPRLAHLPRPWSVLLVGGPLAQIRFDGDVADRIADQAIAGARQAGGSLVTVVNRRTPQPVRQQLAVRVAAAAGLASWSLDWPTPEPNPYPALLALGDRFTVTCDSPSMIADACMTGKPVDLVRLPIAAYLTRLSSRGLGLSLDARRRRRRRDGKGPDALDRLRDSLVAHYRMRPWDEIRDFHHVLDSHGLLAPDAGDRARCIQLAELDAMAMRIAALVSAKRAAVRDRAGPPPIPAEAA
jgi:uncharacterized protein